ncbi:unnamed protein product [Mytilus edulis]|uniref:Uncharacterized protein n=1 Tax=Mytilus edulis TaxID=6550 RepID=A0A8S3QXE8_MYTED|nr:unnamed protein product [Mytilus edulis]
MEPFISPDMDDFYLFDVMYGSSDSEEEIICTSCARGRLRQSVMMPRLPSYKVIHKKKVDFQRHLGVAESEIKKRTLGRGRAKCREIVSQNLPPVGRSVDSTSESSADERIYHVGLSHRSPSWKNELRKPKSKPLILTSDFPHLSAKSENEQQTLEESKKTDDTKNGTNFKDMAKFLMDSWEDEFTEEDQFEDVSFKDDNLEMGDNSYKENNEIKGDYLENEQSIEINSDLKQKTDEYFNKLEAELDNLSLEDFENISVSEASKQRFSQSAKDPVPPAEGKAQGGIWYSGDDVYDSNSKNEETWTDSDDTDVSVSTESLLPCDKSTLPIRSKVKGCDVLPRANFDLTLPGDGSVESQGNVSNVVISGNTHSLSSPHIDHSSSSPQTDHSSSSPDIDHSTLSVSKTESDNQRTSATSDKDESETSESFKKISRKNKKKKRDAARAKDFHSSYPGNNKHVNDHDDTDQNKQASHKCQKNNLSQMNSNACQQNGHGPSNPAAVSWKLVGDSVIQLDGLPVDCDISVLQDLIASYGTVKDFEKKVGPQCSAVRFRLNSTDACEMVVCCLDDTDIFEDMRQSITVRKIHVKFDQKEICLGQFDANLISTCNFFTGLFLSTDDHKDYYLVDLSRFNFASFQHLRHRINYGLALPIIRTDLVQIVDVAAYLGIIETDLEQLFPELDICKDNGQEFVPLIHRLLCKGYQCMAETFGKCASIPHILLQDIAISYNVFKRKCRNQKNLLEWKCKYVYPTCQCPSCEVEKLKLQGD